MKKILSLVLSLCLLMSCAAFAEGADVTGDWFGDMYGMLAVLSVYDDATYSLELMGESDEGAWVMEGDILYMDKGTEAEMPLAYDAEACTLTADLGDGMLLVFGREMPVFFTPAEARTDATVEEYAGSWTATFVDFFGMLAPVDAAGMTMTLTIEDTNATMALSMGEEEPDIATIEGAFADGILTLTIPAESELEEDAVFTVKLLADGTMSCEFSMMGMPVIFYLDAVAAEVAPAA